MNLILVCPFKQLKVEICIYFILWSSVVLYSIYCFAITSNNFFKSYIDEFGDFTTGFEILNRFRDKSDYEYEGILYLLSRLWIWVFSYLIFSEILQKFINNKIVIQYFQVLFSFMVILVQFDSFYLIISLLQPLVFATFWYYFKERKLIYICNFLCLCMINIWKRLIVNYSEANEINISLLVIIIGWMNLKCTSYCLDNNGKYRGFSELLNLFSYCFYLPTLFTGPFLFYEDYENCLKFDNYLPLTRRLKVFLINLIRILSWIYFLHVTLHYVYVNAIGYHPQAIKTFDSWSLYGYGYTMGQYFHMKYIIYYGLATNLAKFQNIPVPFLPRCIGRIHLYSDMWRYFDVGLYNFLVRYIYVPFLRSKLPANKMISNFLCFCFVFIWHGIADFILIWTIINYFSILAELGTKNVYEKCIKTKYEKDIGHFWIRNIKCLLSTPLLIISAISNFYYFAGTEIGNLFFYRLWSDEFYKTFILLIAMFACCQVSTEVRKINARRM